MGRRLRKAELLELPRISDPLKGGLWTSKWAKIRICNVIDMVKCILSVPKRRLFYNLFSWNKGADIVYTNHFYCSISYSSQNKIKQQKRKTIDHWLWRKVESINTHSLTGLLVAVVQLLSRVWLFVTLWTEAHQTPLSMALSRQEYWSACHFLLQGIFLDQGWNPHLLHR